MPVAPYRAAAPIAYDSGRGVTVLFGGSGNSVQDYAVLGDTWEWDGINWRLRDVAGPPAREGHAIVYDSARMVTVLFGGAGHEAILGDTWEWDGVAWTERKVTGPPPRWAHQLAYDSTRGVVVLFGGTPSTGYPESLSDTWEWDGTSWSQRGTVGPAARSQHAMTYDSVRNETLLFGGYDTNLELLRDTWAWDGTEWVPRSSDDAGNAGCSMVFDTQRSVAFCTTGGNSAEWNGTQWTAVPDDGGIDPHFGGPVAYDIARNRTVLSARGEIWERSGTQWIPHAMPGGCFADHFKGVYDATRGVTVLLDPCHEETWEWNGTAWSIEAIDSPTGPQGQDNFAFDGSRGLTLWYLAPNLWQWNGVSWTSQTTVGGPNPPAYHEMVFDLFRQVSWLLDSAFGRMWAWNGSQWAQVGAQSLPGGRYGYRMVYDAKRAVTVLFGGTNAAAPPTYYDETWEWNGAAWSLRSDTGPSPRARHGMVYDSRRGVSVLFGGTAECPFPSSPCVGLDDLWEWDGAVWTQRDYPGAPSPRYAHVMTYDSRRGAVVLWAGDHFAEFGVLDIFWELVPYTADSDDDCDVDLADAAAFQRCLGLPPSQVGPECSACDTNMNGTVGAEDLAAFTAHLSGPDVQSNP